MAKSNGPGSSSQRGRSARGRTTPKGSPSRTAALGRYVDAEDSGRYTRAIPKDVKVSPRWYGPVILALLVLASAPNPADKGPLVDPRLTRW